MRKPSAKTLFAGSPYFAVPVIAFHVVTLGGLTLDRGFGWWTVYGLVFVAYVSNCYQAAAAYRRFAAEWNALDPNYRPPRPLRDGIRFVRSVVVAVPIIVGCFWLFLHYDDPTSVAHIIAPMLVVGLPLLWIVSLVVRRKRRRTSPQEWIVTQAPSRSLPAPCVADAHAQLPDYCAPLFTPHSERKEQS
jgi:hypothetical protein